MEKVLAGAIRREMARDEQCAKQAAEIQQLNRLVGVFLSIHKTRGYMFLCLNHSVFFSGATV